MLTPPCLVVCNAFPRTGAGQSEMMQCSSRFMGALACDALPLAGGKRYRASVAAIAAYLAAAAHAIPSPRRYLDVPARGAWRAAPGGRNRAASHAVAAGIFAYLSNTRYHQPADGRWMSDAHESGGCARSPDGSATACSPEIFPRPGNV